MILKRPFQWLALTPPEMVKATLNLDDDTISHFSKTKPVVVAPSKINDTATD